VSAAGLERVTSGVIALNGVLLAVPLVGDLAVTELAERAESACLVWFVVELAVRFHRVGARRFCRSGWCWFDAVVILLAVLPMLGADATLLRMLRLSRMARLLHLGRHAPVLAMAVRRVVSR